MKSQVATRLLSEVQNTIAEVNAMGITNPKQLAYFGKYLIVLMSGIYEESIEQILREKFSRTRLRYVSRYLESNIRSTFRNPTFTKIIGLLGSFDPEWKTKLNRLPNINKDAITSVVNIKNNLGHTGSASITWSEAITYNQNSIVVIEKIDSILL